MRDIVAVIGTTGVGKSDLAVSLAQRIKAQSPNQALPIRLGNSGGIGGTDTPAHAGPSRYKDALILSADSMQLYEGLDVITNKMTEEEMGGVDHWGLDIVKPGEPSWELGRWCTEADKQIAGMQDDTLPIVCGGTHYFIQHFLFPPPEIILARSPPGTKAPGKDAGRDDRAWRPPCDLPQTPELLERPDLRRLLETFWTSRPIWPDSDSAAHAEDATHTRESLNQAAQGECSKHASQDVRNTAANWTDAQLLSLHQLLSALNPSEAQRWHWRDGRKVKRSIERWWEAQVQHRPTADINKEADRGAGEDGIGCKAGRRARFRTLVFWVYEDIELLKSRLDRRVDRMVENGLLREIAELRAVATALYGSPGNADHAEGIFQSIGYKEFAHLSLSQPDPTADPAFPSMLDRMKISTRQYAKSQIKWIRKQLLPAIREARALAGDVEVYVVPGGSAGQEKAGEVMNAFLQGRPLPPAQTIHPIGDLLDVLDELEGGVHVPDTIDRQSINARRDCKVCSSPSQPCSIGVKEWEVHVKSKSHKRNARLATEDKASMIARLKAEGQARKAERAKLFEEEQMSVAAESAAPSNA